MSVPPAPAEATLASAQTRPSKPAITIPLSPSTQPQTPTSSTATPSRARTQGYHARHRSIDIDELSKNRVQGSPVARRMSMSSTPQGRLDIGGGGLTSIRGLGLMAQRILKREGVVVGGLCAASLITGTLLSLIFRTALSTSISSTPLSSSYFAQKSNFFNAYLVKLSWLHTSVIYLLHLFSSPPSGSRFPRLATYLIATALWAAFTNWFFGAGLGDRIIELSGGACALVIPPQGLDAAIPGISSGLGANLEMLSKVLPGSEIVKTGDETLLHLPSTFCTLRKPLTETSHPGLFNLLSSSLSDAADSAKDALPMATQLQSLIPRWRKGFDISGHAFLLTLAAILLSRELAPTWRRWLSKVANEDGTVGIPSGFGARRRAASTTSLVHTLSGVVGTGLLMVWIGMLGVTGMYFHDPPEKLSGLILGLTAGALLNIAPQSPFTSPASTRSSATDSNVSGDGFSHVTSRGSNLVSNENRARRGEVVDNGVILSPLPEEEDDNKQNQDAGKREGADVFGGSAGMRSAGGQGTRVKAE